MAAYDATQGTARNYETYRRALAWLSPERHTGEVRRLVEGLRDRHRSTACTWRGTKLQNRYDVDHVVPWARWPCNDLWNLVPTSVAANASKGDRLPSAEALASAEERFQACWTLVRGASDETAARFEQEVRATLPFVAHPSNAQDLFDGVALLRASLRRNQQIPEWSG